VSNRTSVLGLSQRDVDMAFVFVCASIAAV